MPGLSESSGQDPVNYDEVSELLYDRLPDGHSLNLIEADTRQLKVLPAAYQIFIDAGHTRECLLNDITLSIAAIEDEGMLIFHDYRQPIWPEVTETLVQIFGEALDHREHIAWIRGREAKRAAIDGLGRSNAREAV
jgi:hypothetical protein